MIGRDQDRPSAEAVRAEFLRRDQAEARRTGEERKNMHGLSALQADAFRILADSKRFTQTQLRDTVARSYQSPTLPPYVGPPVHPETRDDWRIPQLPKSLGQLRRERRAAGSSNNRNSHRNTR